MFRMCILFSWHLLSPWRVMVMDILIFGILAVSVLISCTGMFGKLWHLKKIFYLCIVIRYIWSIKSCQDHWILFNINYLFALQTLSLSGESRRFCKSKIGKSCVRWLTGANMPQEWFLICVNLHMAYNSELELYIIHLNVPVFILIDFTYSLTP